MPLHCSCRSILAVARGGTLFGKRPYANLAVEHFAGGWDDARADNSRQKHNLSDMFFMLHISVVLLLCSRQIITVAIGNKSEPLLINVDILHHVAVHPIVFDEVADPRNPKKLVVIGEKGL